MSYDFTRRPPGSSRSQVAVRAQDSSRNVSNARALYERPILVHSGPTPMRQTESLSEPYAWPWVRLDTAPGVPTRLDEATIWPARARGSVDISLRLVGLYALINPNVEPAEDPTGNPTVAPVTIKAELLQYTTGISPTLISDAVLNTDVLCYPAYVKPWYPLISLLSMGMAADPASPDYDPARQNTGAGGLLRTGQLYPADLPLLQRVRLSLNFEAKDWSPTFAAARDYPCFLRVTLTKDSSRSIAWSNLALTNPEFVRIFCVGSAMYQRGRL